MNQIAYTASILARIGLMFPPDSEEHHAIRDALTLLEEKEKGDELTCVSVNHEKS